jgi:hypothetical protein
VTPPLNELLRRVDQHDSGWTVSEVAHNRWLSPGIWQLERDGHRVIVKWLSAHRDAGTTPYESHWTANSHEPTRWNYWLREALAYKHRLSDAYLDAGMGGPTCLGVDITADDAVFALGFEEGIPGDQWTISQYADAARALGRAQGVYLIGQRPVPSHEWLSHGFLRIYSTAKPVDWALLDSDAAWDQPLVADCFPAGLRSAAAELHRCRDRLYAIAESLPQTLCHLDFWSKNLIRRSDGSHVLLDWAFVGMGAIGEDIGNLIPDACFDHFIDSTDLPALDTAVFGAYVAGLNDAGWNGDSEVVRLGLWVSAVKYDWLTPLMLASAAATRQLKYGGTEEIDATVRFRERGAALLFNANRAVAALDLATRLGR